jgi:DNA (cytosine-5)-methyltransferase 1
MRNEPLFLVVDLFCGAGGTTTGFAQAELAGNKLVKVIACVNHDPKAIKSHWRNHPDVIHFEEDIRTLKLAGLVEVVRKYQALYPNAYLILWASLECTNFSKAKGGQPRDADSRTLADHLDRYVLALKPDYIQIENVVEFMSWGPLDENGKPVSRKNGRDWLRWRELICSHGYTDDWREMNSANYGAYTSRNRLFGIFAKEGLPIAYPIPTHAKNPAKAAMYGELKRWNAVKEVLEFEHEGESIFNRKKDLSPKTLERIYAGLIKYVAKGEGAFISKYFSGKPKGKVNSVNSPASTVTTFGNQTLVQTKNFSDVSTDEPVGALTTVDHHALVQGKFLLQTYAADSKGANVFGIDRPARTLTTRDATQMVSPQ